MYLDVMNGGLVCEDCLRRQSSAPGNSQTPYDDTKYQNNILVPMGAGAVAAADYVMRALPERVYAFRIKNEADTDDLRRAGETYLPNHLECGFASLDFYKTIIK